MVRRWSYLNLLNSSHLVLDANYMKHMRSHMFRTFKATTFFRRRLYLEGPSKLTRKSYYHRRRVNNSLFYYNVMVNWSQDYLFFRKYSRELLMLGASTYNYLIQNTLVYSSTPLNELPGYESFQFTYFVNSVVKYCLNTSKFSIPSLYALSKNSFIYTTSTRLIQSSKKQKMIFDDPTYQLVNKRLFEPTYQGLSFSCGSLFNLLFRNYIVNLTNLYRILTLLLYASLFGQLPQNYFVFEKNPLYFQRLP
jgi:hypothetical protein